MKTLDEVADMLSKEGRGFAVVQYDAKDGKGVEYRYKAEDIETMLGFLIPIVDSICNEYVENEGYLVCESIRQTVEKTMMMNDTRPSEELFEKNLKRLQEIFANYKYEPEEDEDDNPALTWDELKQMERKPVWVEYNFQIGDKEFRDKSKRWCIIREFMPWHDTEIIITENGFVLSKNNQINSWQAYRKERV